MSMVACVSVRGFAREGIPGRVSVLGHVGTRACFEHLCVKVLWAHVSVVVLISFGEEPLHRLGRLCKERMDFNTTGMKTEVLRGTVRVVYAVCVQRTSSALLICRPWCVAYPVRALQKGAVQTAGSSVLKALSKMPAKGESRGFLGSVFTDLLHQ